ncbi:acyl carrier protein [Kitasatospora mediocidica]|uniref:acyl carrier protein n=1 Tax=Kitasatospora mediocidica TaxID=58352 RepID=UPI00056A64AF|nr:phosphopantetheine-binding protein [Kitasatospora mediocidica]
MSATTAADVDKVREIIADALDLEAEELTLTGLFIEDYGADSLSAIEVLASLEKAFGVTIQQDELHHMISLEAVLEVLSRAAAR